MVRAAGVEHLTLLTGDNAPTAEALAQRTGIEDVRAELLPAENTDSKTAYRSTTPVGPDAER